MEVVVVALLWLCCEVLTLPYAFLVPEQKNKKQQNEACKVKMKILHGDQKQNTYAIAVLRKENTAYWDFRLLQV